ncbi:MAG: Beta-barrel assembly-enhancing protease [Alphaproteobacteria bacterium MarineAlpha2_Bin1]|nr:MAG: Beta-barrel assembly-enhancing protease [Alphaproteobacteria bacterium MarineAlpha2_Bin1]
MNKSISNILKKLKTNNLNNYVILLFIFVILFSCSKNPYTEKNELTLFMNKEQEQKIGDIQHNKIVNYYGGIYKSQILGPYIASIGASIANSAELGDQSFTFTILNSPIVNAFALPGGYIYLTRGLITLCRSESELAFVIAHEMAHVLARHTAQRHSRDILGKIGATIIGASIDSVVAEDLGHFVNNLTIARFSRANELEADSLAIKYLIKSGYDPGASSDFLSTLIELKQYRKKIGFPENDSRSVFATHPPTIDRVESSKKLSVSNKKITNHSIFFENLNGVIYGDDPSQGIIVDETFLHPSLNFSMHIPENFLVDNRSKTLTAIRKNIALMKIDVSSKSSFHPDPVTYLKNIWQSNKKMDLIEGLKINDFEAATGYFFTNGRINDYTGRVQVRYLAIRLDSRKYLRLIFISREDGKIFNDKDFRSIAISIKKLNKNDVEKSIPLRVFFIEIKNDIYSNELIKNEMEGKYKAERFELLNSINKNEFIKKGTIVKVLKYKK